MTKAKKTTEQVRANYIIDARGNVLGKIATKAANLLRGKEKTNFESYLDQGDSVVIVNSAGLVLTGNKLENKKYYHHTSHPGGIKTDTLSDLMAKDPGDVIRRAVYGMLPKNKLRNEFIKRLTTINDDSYAKKESDIEVKI